jgi:nitrogen fixation NifU-like protein
MRSSLDELEDAQAFKDIAHMPARVKCATLGWHTLDEVLTQGKK